MFKRDSTASSYSISYTALNREHDWEDLCIQSRTHQTCTFWYPYITKSWGLSFPNCLLLMLHCRLANATQVALCNQICRTWRRTLKKTKPNNTHMPCPTLCTPYPTLIGRYINFGISWIGSVLRYQHGNRVSMSRFHLCTGPPTLKNERKPHNGRSAIQDNSEVMGRGKKRVGLMSIHIASWPNKLSNLT